MGKETQKIKARYHLSVMLMTAGVFGKIMHTYKAEGFSWHTGVYSLVAATLYAYCFFVIQRGTKARLKIVDTLHMNTEATELPAAGIEGV